MIINLLRRFKWVFLLATILSTISAFAGVAMLSVITERIASLSGETQGVHEFVFFAAALIGVVIFGITSQYILARLGAQIVFEIQNTMSRRLLRTPYEKMEKMGGHRIMATLGTDVSSFSKGLMILPQFIYSITTVLFCLAYMFYSSWQMTVLVILTLAVIIFVAQIFIRYGMVHMTALREHSDVFYSGLRTLVDGGKELNINANRKAQFYETILSPVFSSIRDGSIKVSTAFISLNSWTNVSIFGLIGAVIYGSVYFPGVTAGTIIGFSLLILYLVEPLENIVEAVQDAGTFIVSYRKIESLELSEDTGFFAGRINDEGMPVNWKSLVVKSLTYTYRRGAEDYAFSIGPFDLNFERGKTYFLTGGNGSGKSTFAKVLVGLYTPESGGIYIDNREVGRDISQEWYCANFSTIFSDFFLFDQVLDRNGGLADDAIIGEYLKKFKLSDKVKIEGGVLSSVDLSQGQKKRLALLLSYIEDAPICVYDEWTADQDPYFREYFYKVLLPEQKRKGKTMIVITHDDRYFHLADGQIRFEDGKAVCVLDQNKIVDTELV